MNKSSQNTFTDEVRAALRARFSAVALALHKLTSDLPLWENIAYTVDFDQNSRLPNFAQVPILQELRKGQEFRELYKLALEESSIWQVLLDSRDPGARDWERNQMLSNYVELILLRISACLERIAFSYRPGTSEFVGVEPMLDSLMDFLSLGEVERQVQVPLFNLALSVDEIRVPHLFYLQRLHEAHTCKASVPLSLMNFYVTTGHFTTALVSPVWQEIRKRVTLIRLAGQPLTAYNHFWVENFAPWEMPILDSEFSMRFWGKEVGKLTAAPVTLNQEQADDIASLTCGIDSIRWGTVTPWRLAADRLDDAVFKVSRRHPGHSDRAGSDIHRKRKSAGEYSQGGRESSSLPRGHARGEATGLYTGETGL